MQKIKLDSSNLQVSALAMGSDVLGSKIDQDTTFSLLDYYVGEGGNFIDTGNFYASWLPGCKGGESETVIGAWMKARGNRDKVIISSKLAFDYPGCEGGLSAAEIERECEKSLRRLQTDRLDLYYAHRDDREVPQEETMAAFDRLIRAGKVRALGASNLAVWRIAQANAVAKANGFTPYTIVQQRYTYLRPRHGADFGPQIVIGPELKDFALIEGIALVAYSILLQGAYTRTERELPAQFAGPESNQRLDALREVAKETERSVNQIIIAWMRQSKPAVLPIIAGSRINQLKENITALDLCLSEEQMQKLNTAGDPVIRQAWIQPK
ncbi:MAG: aldo/keto reductase [Acidobacteriaceae bacterium]|nr:aldo/keto reductase [Acidobacteriaceae bacterium]